MEKKKDVHAESLAAVDRLLNENPEEVQKIFLEIDAIAKHDNGITVQEYFDGFEYEYQRWWNNLAK